MRKPFWFTQKQCWYVKDFLGKAVRLDPDETKAFDLWQRMRDLQDSASPAVTVTTLCDLFLGEYADSFTEPRLKKITQLLESFCTSVGVRKQGREVTKADLKAWLNATRTIRGDEDGKWSTARKRDAGTIVKRVFRWAFNEGYLPKNTMAEFRLETPAPRSEVIDPETHRMLVEACREMDRSKPFALLLIAFHCGARPIQVRQVTAANVSPNFTTWVFPNHKTRKKTGKPLVVHLSPCLQTLTRILAERHKGLLFPNWFGKAYTKDAVVTRMRRLRAKLKIEGAIAYAYRHTFATDALLAGLDVSTVAALLGHKDSAMVSKVYGHLDQNTIHMQLAAAKVAKRRLADK